MKRFISIALALLFTVTAFAEEKIGWVHLNNGRTIKGEVKQSGTKVFITTENGTELSFPMVEVREISYNELTLPSVAEDVTLRDMADSETGFWFSSQLIGSYSIFLSNRCTPWSELNINGGYRFNQYMRVGVGIGCRYYFDNAKLRQGNIKVSFPIYATLRGNIIEETYRTVVPYYSFDLGGAVRDGFMWRPTFGIRVGQKRSAFIAGICYTGQSLKDCIGKQKYVSSLGITLGYEY